MKRIFKFIENNFFVIVILFVAITLLYPNIFSWVLGKVHGINIMNLLLSIILFGMGTTLKFENFTEVFKKPKEIGVGLIAQYMIMPLLALTLAYIFKLDTALTAGLILVGTVPGGTASDVITFLAKGDLALSVSLTAISTVISPLLTPLITVLLIGNHIHFNPIEMFISIVQIVLIPIILGLLVNYKFPDFTENLKDYLPAVSSIVICLIIGGVLGANINSIYTASWIILVVIILQYFIGVALGFVVGYLSGMKMKQITTVAIELGFQNSGLSTSLAKTHFPNYPIATVPGALYSVWQNLAGSILAYLFRKYLNKEE
ncbi:bile acid:sodium symporter family protein [Methanosphaera sp. ISO3-F5]|uniref:bile acid:sodium symporter family protein n=1 Tax=Methanosphaera sp. ISO3-F5 TaxID=1452353 RepID=UPI002B259CB3|nr:bile acid:sodium symporter family protein [Methanosphaera sp. ISO3-F5]WQH65060.1 bile acid:sodium symporter family protein [Methanosphaera sp. ISO3-F5]